MALAMVGDPEVLFLDEPTTGLDPQSRRQLWEVIRDFRARGRTIVLTTHYMDEAERLCDRVAIIDHGKIIAQGSPAELISRLGGDHIIEFALEESAAGMPLELNTLLGLESVLAARGENDGFVLTVAQPHRAIPALLERGRPRRAVAGPLDDEACESRGRVRCADRPPLARRQRRRPGGTRTRRAEKPLEDDGLDRACKDGSLISTLSRCKALYAAIVSALPALPGPSPRLLPPAGAGLLGLRLSDDHGDRARVRISESAAGPDRSRPHEEIGRRRGQSRRRGPQRSHSRMRKLSGQAATERARRSSCMKHPKKKRPNG